MNIDSDKLRFAMLPSGYKAGTLYSQFPNVSESDFDVVRNSIGTRVNKDGLIEVMDANVPRLDYSDGGCPKLLTELSSINKLPYSEDFSQSIYQKRDLTISGGYLSPKGDNTAYLCTGNDSDCAVNTNFTTVKNYAYTLSVYLKSNNGENIDTSISLGSGSFPNSEGDGGKYKNITISGEWKRYYISSTATSASVTVIGVLGGFGGMNSGDEILIWGASLEVLGHPSSYIPTNGSAFTRQADQVTNAGDSSTFNSQSGVLLWDAKKIGSGGSITINDSSVSNRVLLGINTNGTITVIFSVNNVYQYIQTVSQFDSALQNKISLSWKVNKFQLYINGLLCGEDTSGIVYNSGVLNQLSLNNAGNGYLQAKTKSIQHYDYLSDLEMEELTGYDSYSAMTSQFNFNVL